MRGLLAVVFTVSFYLLGAPELGGQDLSSWNRRAEPRGPLVPLRRELLRPVGPARIEDLRVRPESTLAAERAARAPNAPDRARRARICPMPVARPDTTTLERMPVGRADSARMAPMPVAEACENPMLR
jgi:hypothetical protein